MMKALLFRLTGILTPVPAKGGSGAGQSHLNWLIVIQTDYKFSGLNADLPVFGHDYS